MEVYRDLESGGIGDRFREFHDKGIDPRMLVLTEIGYLHMVCERHNLPHYVIHFPDVVEEEGPDFNRLATVIASLGISRAQAMRAIRSMRHNERRRLSTA